MTKKTTFFNKQKGIWIGALIGLTISLIDIFNGLLINPRNLLQELIGFLEPSELVFFLFNIPLSATLFRILIAIPVNVLIYAGIGFLAQILYIKLFRKGRRRKK